MPMKLLMLLMPLSCMMDWSHTSASPPLGGRIPVSMFTVVVLPAGCRVQKVARLAYIRAGSRQRMGVRV